MLIEVCCDNIHSVSIAAQNGADRIELCTALELGGLTPGTELIKAAQDITDVPLMILIRPRAGGFHYAPLEKHLILKEIESALKLNVTGVVIGALDTHRDLDIPFMREMMNLAADVSVTFHRAFDFLEDPLEAIHILADLGLDRILTSGQEPSAEKGLDNLIKYSAAANDSIIIMPGAGIHSKNIKNIIEAASITEVHLSAKKKIILTQENDPFSTDYYLTDAAELNQIIKTIRK